MPEDEDGSLDAYLFEGLERCRSYEEGVELIQGLVGKVDDKTVKKVRRRGREIENEELKSWFTLWEADLEGLCFYERLKKENKEHKVRRLISGSSPRTADTILRLLLGLEEEDIDSLQAFLDKLVADSARWQHSDALDFESQRFEDLLHSTKNHLYLLTLLALKATDREEMAKAFYLRGKTRLVELDYARRLSRGPNLHEIIDDAEGAFNSALELSGSLTTRWMCYRDLAIAVSWRDPNQCLQYLLAFRKELAGRRPSTEEENNLIIHYKLDTWYCLQDTYRDLGKPQDALAILQEAIDLSELHLSTLYGAILVSDFLQSNPPIYGEMIELSLELAKEHPEYEKTALETLEKTSARAFVEFISKSGTVDEGNLSRISDKQKELRELSSNLQYLGANPDGIDPAERRRIELRMGQIHQFLWQHADIRQRTKKPLLFDEIVERIPDDTFLIEYHRTADKIMVFVVSSDGDFEVVPLKIPILFDDSIFDANTAIGVRSNYEPILYLKKNIEFLSVPGLNLFSLSSLYDALIEPIADIIKSKKSLIIVPNEGLTKVPFHALYREEGGKMRHLVEDFAVSYTPSMSMLDRPSKSGKVALETCFSAGVPEDKGGPEKSSEEAYMVARSFNTEPFPATKESLISNARLKDVVHLSCHSASKNRLPRYNGLMLEDGLLTPREIIESVRSLKCSLVTLSACSTFDDYTTDQTDGLTGVLMKVGAKSVLSSLWKAPAGATSMLMEEFYRNLKELNKAKALQKAQIKVRENELYTHPFFWAPFFLLGDVE